MIFFSRWPVKRMVARTFRVFLDDDIDTPHGITIDDDINTNLPASSHAKITKHSDKYIRELVDLLSNDRTEDYHNWVCLGWCLKALSTMSNILKTFGKELRKIEL